MRYFRDGVLKMIIKKVLPGDGSTFLIPLYRKENILVA